MIFETRYLKQDIVDILLFDNLDFLLIGKHSVLYKNNFLVYLLFSMNLSLCYPYEINLGRKENILNDKLIYPT